MEHEVRNHALKAVKIMNNKQMGFLHKVQEIAIEIGIIVFAITLSIWMHDRSEHAHQQEQVKSFLLGLKQDLKKDIVEMELDRNSYVSQGKFFQYLSGSSPSFKPDQDTIKRYSALLFNTTYLISHNGRYEGFKSSGKLGDIEDEKLQNAITDLYQDAIPEIEASTNLYIKYKELLFAYLSKNVQQVGTNQSNAVEVLSKDEAKNIYLFLRSTGEVVSRYEQGIKQAEKIVKDIDSLYQK
jgi:hypothetical protein